MVWSGVHLAGVEAGVALVHPGHLQPVGDHPVLPALPARPLPGHHPRPRGGGLLPGELDAQRVPGIQCAKLKVICSTPT